MEALAVVVDLNYKIIYLDSNLGIKKKKQIYLGWRNWVKKNDFNNFSHPLLLRN